MTSATQTVKVEDANLRDCPFCGATIKHVESLARSFDPPRVYHEYQHPRNGCLLFDGIISSFSDDPEPRLKFVAAWNGLAPASAS